MQEDCIDRNYLERKSIDEKKLVNKVLISWDKKLVVFMEFKIRSFAEVLSMLW